MSLPPSHRSSTEMARVLVQYIEDPFRVRRLCRAEWNHAPDLSTIKSMRARYTRQKAKTKPVIDDTEVNVAHMEQANKAFLDAVERAGRKVVR